MDMLARISQDRQRKKRMILGEGIKNAAVDRQR
jgi:hypothetical protein